MDSPTFLDWSQFFLLLFILSNNIAIAVALALCYEVLYWNKK